MDARRHTPRSPRLRLVGAGNRPRDAKRRAAPPRSLRWADAWPSRPALEAFALAAAVAVVALPAETAAPATATQPAAALQRAEGTPVLHRAAALQRPWPALPLPRGSA